MPPWQFIVGTLALTAVLYPALLLFTRLSHRYANGFLTSLALALGGAVVMLLIMGTGMYVIFATTPDPYGWLR